MKLKSKDVKFKFTVDFQLDLLRYTVLDKNGYKALELYNDTYFTLTEHAIIAYSLKSYYKRKKSVPGITMLLEELINRTFNHRDFINNITDEDRKEILNITRNLFTGTIKDGDEILLNTEKFAQFVDLKNEVENINLLNFDEYDIFSKKVQKAISPRLRTIEEKGYFLVKDIKYRQTKRKEKSSIVPLPWPQLNSLTNAGGYAKGSILVILDKAKKFKTGCLVNISKRYMQFYKKNVLVIDLDNGEEEFMVRIEQSIANATKKEILDEDGEADKRVREVLRRSKKHGGEIVIKRFPALVTTANDIGNYMDYIYREYGFQTDILVIDYIAKMGSISGKESLHERIGDAYIDIGNLALEKDIDLVWTAQHVTREGAKLREKSVYESTDVAGAIDITRHVQALYGLNRSPMEEQNGYQRLEIIDQRDGPPTGHVVFDIDITRQRLTPLGKDRLDTYYEVYNVEKEEENDHSYNGHKKPKKRNDLEHAE